MGLDTSSAAGEAKEGLWRRRDHHGRRLIDESSNVDHVTLGHMGPVKNQGGCGSCWAFTTSTTLEGTIAAKTNTAPVHVSEQHQLDCSKANYGCDGGWMNKAYKFWRDEGAYLESEYPYVGDKGNDDDVDHCDTSGKSRFFTPGDFWGMEWVDDIDALKERLVLQPMSVAISADDIKFQQYRSGIYKGSAACDNTDAMNVNHAVVLVGFTDTADTENQSNDTPYDGGDSNDGDTTPAPIINLVDKWWYYDDSQTRRRLQDNDQANDRYWKIQNSWGSSWGDEGFIKFEIQEGAGVCNMNRYVEYIDMTQDWYDNYNPSN